MSEDVSAVRIGHLQGNKVSAAYCQLRYSKTTPASEAAALWRSGKTVFVRCEDAHQVLDELGANVTPV